MWKWYSSPRGDSSIDQRFARLFRVVSCELLSSRCPVRPVVCVLVLCVAAASGLSNRPLVSYCSAYLCLCRWPGGNGGREIAVRCVPDEVHYVSLMKKVSRLPLAQFLRKIPAFPSLAFPNGGRLPPSFENDFTSRFHLPGVRDASGCPSAACVVRSVTVVCELICTPPCWSCAPTSSWSDFSLWWFTCSSAVSFAWRPAAVPLLCPALSLVSLSEDDVFPCIQVSIFASQRGMQSAHPFFFWLEGMLR